MDEDDEQKNALDLAAACGKFASFADGPYHASSLS